MRIFSKLSQLISPFIYFFVAPAIALADVSPSPIPANPCPESGNFANLCAITGPNFGKFVANAITAAMVVAALIALGFLIYGGVKWVMSQGDKADIETARNTIVGAIIGLIVVFLSYLIISVILGFFGIKLQDLSIPTLISGFK